MLERSQVTYTADEVQKIIADTALVEREVCATLCLSFDSDVGEACADMIRRQSPVSLDKKMRAMRDRIQLALDRARDLQTQTYTVAVLEGLLEDMEILS